MTTTTEPTTLASILAEGRAKLAHLRHEQDQEARAKAEAAEARAEDHWQALREVAGDDVPECLWEFTNLVARPEDWQGAGYHVTTSFDLVIRPPGFAPVLGIYGYDRRRGAWQRRSYDRFSRNFAWAVPIHVLTCGREGDRCVGRCDERSWHYTDDLALALAAAEQEGANLAALEVEAAEQNRQRQEEADRAARRKPLERTPAERLHDVISEIAREAVAEREES